MLINKANDSDEYDIVDAVKERVHKRDCILVRWVLAFWSCVGFSIVYMLRVNMSVALIAMVNNTAVREAENVSEDCAARYNDSIDESEEDGPFIWNRYTQGVILSSFFYGYVSTQIIGGCLADRYSPKQVFGLGVLITSLFTLLTPVAANYSANVLIAVRVLTGIGEGVTFPAIGSMWSKWAPKDERAILVSISYSGSLFGLVLGMPLSGALSNSGLFGGWPSIFYVCGLIGCVWYVFWIFFTFDSPSQHPRISQHERSYIEKSIGKIPPPIAVTAVPWLSIWTSPPVLALALASFTSSWGFYVLLTSLPQYLKVILRFRITENSYLSMLPHISGFFFTVLSGFIADYITKKKLLRSVNNRKVNAFITLIPAAVFTALVPHVGCNAVYVMVLLCVAMATNGFSSGCFSINYMDLAPRLSGTVFGFVNTCANMAGILSPLIVGIITNKQSTMKEWRIVFYISSIIYGFGALVYLLFASAEVQPWADDIKNEDENRTLLINEDVVNEIEEKPQTRTPLVHRRNID